MLYIWLQATAELDYNELHVAHASVQYAAVWLQAGQSARWKLRFLPGSPGNAVKLRRVFMPATTSAVAAVAAVDGSEAGGEGSGEGGVEGSGEGGGEGGGEVVLQESEVTVQAEDDEHVDSFVSGSGAGMVPLPPYLLHTCYILATYLLRLHLLCSYTYYGTERGHVPRCTDPHSARNPM